MKWNPKDKLYINPYGWNSKPSRSDEVEYIRKDALLDWLKEHINNYLVHGRDIDLMFDDIKNAF